MAREVYVYRPEHPKANERGFVNVMDLGYEPEPRAVDAPIMAGRFYENQKATDGTDIGSRAKHRAYMKQNGLTTTDDFKETWAKKAEERADFYKTGGDHKARREAIERAIYQRYKP